MPTILGIATKSYHSFNVPKVSFIGDHVKYSVAYGAYTIIEEADVRYVMSIKRCDNADDLERVIFVILEWIAQICKAGHVVH